MTHAEAMTQLRQRGVKIDSKDRGKVLILRLGTRVFSYWPGTARWHERVRTHAPLHMDTTPAQRGQGVDSLLEACK